MTQINTWYSGLLNPTRRTEKFKLSVESIAAARALIRRSKEQVRKASMTEHRQEALYVINTLTNAHTSQVMIALGIGYPKAMRLLNGLHDEKVIIRKDGFARGARTVVWSIKV
jgi:hypothetical protein